MSTSRRSGFSSLVAMVMREQRSGPPQCLELRDEGVDLVGGIEAAWAWQDPYQRAFEAFPLRADACLRPSEGMAVGAQAEEGDGARTVAAHLAREAPAAGDEFRRGKLGGAGRGASDQVGEAVARSKNKVLLRRMQQARRESGAVQRRPEAVPGPGKVVAGRRRIKAGIDAAEQYLQAGRDDIGELP